MKDVQSASTFKEEAYQKTVNDDYIYNYLHIIVYRQQLIPNSRKNQYTSIQQYHTLC